MKTKVGGGGMAAMVAVLAAVGLIDVDIVAEMLGVGARTVWRLRDSGRMPAPITIAGCKCIRWNRQTIQFWIADGCPDVRRTGWIPPATGCAGGCAGKGGA